MSKLSYGLEAVCPGLLVQTNQCLILIYVILHVLLFYYFFVAASPQGALSVTVPRAKKGKGGHPPCHGMQEEAEEEDEVELAGLPPARKRAQQQGREEAVPEEDV